MSSDSTTRLHPLWRKSKGCAECTVCEGSGYQTPPVLFAGNPDAPILALGQNPGEIKESDLARQRWMGIFKSPFCPNPTDYMPLWYLWDFTTSPGYSRMEYIFGRGWILDGVVAWSNVVRCRTKDNGPPSTQMVENCKTWTNALLEGRKAVILVGAVAKNAVLDDDAGKLEWGVPRRHPHLGIALAIKHYVAWSARDEAMYAQAFRRVLEALK